MTNTIYRVALLLNLTGLYRFVPWLAGVDSSYTGLALLLLNLAYVFTYWPAASRLIAQRSVVEWLILLLAWPLMVMLLLALGGEGGDLAGKFASQLYLASLLLGGATFVAVCGWEALRRLGMVALGVTLVGFALSWVFPTFMLNAARALDPTMTLGSGRASGFFLQPNHAATACAALLLLAVGDKTRVTFRLRVLVCGLVIAMVALTGSRGGILLVMIVSGVVLWDSRHEIGGSFRRMTSSTRVVVMIGLFGILVVAVVVSLARGGTALAGGEREDLGRRIAFWTDFGESADLSEDRSLRARLDAQRAYVEAIAQHPVLGYGPSGTETMISFGLMEKASHNLFLEKAFRFGVPYSILILVIFARMFRRGRRLIDEKAGVLLSQLAILLLFAGLNAGGVLEVRTVILTVGGVLGCFAALRRPSSRLEVGTR